MAIKDEFETLFSLTCEPSLSKQLLVQKFNIRVSVRKCIWQFQGPYEVLSCEEIKVANPWHWLITVFLSHAKDSEGPFFFLRTSLLFVHPRFSKALVWLQVSIRRNFSRTLVVLDNKIEALLPDDTSGTNSNQQLFSYYSNNKEGNGNSEQEFGSNFSANSFVYVGGLPSFYSTKLSSLALPSAVFEPRFRGSIRNVVYADDESGRPRRQEVMAYKVSNFWLL